MPGKAATREQIQEHHAKPGNRFDFYFDSKSTLPVKAVFPVPELYRNGSYLLTVRMQDYKTTDGWRHPTRMLHERGGKPVEEITIQSLVLGKRYGDELFKRPTRRG